MEKGIKENDGEECTTRMEVKKKIVRKSSGGGEERES